jgi:hypothetical protein
LQTTLWGSVFGSDEALGGDSFATWYEETVKGFDSLVNEIAEEMIGETPAAVARVSGNATASSDTGKRAPTGTAAERRDSDVNRNRPAAVPHGSRDDKADPRVGQVVEVLVNHLQVWWNSDTVGTVTIGATGVVEEVSHTCYRLLIKWTSGLPDGPKRLAQNPCWVKREDMVKLRVKACKSAHDDQPDDAPGRYRIVGKETFLSKSVALGGTIIRKLEWGESIDIVEINVRHADHRVRGRVKECDGWISLLNLQNGYRWAEKRGPLEEVYDTCAESHQPAVSSTANAANPAHRSAESLKVGDKVIRKGQEGVIVHIDETFQPPSYTVRMCLDGREVGSEPHLLRKVSSSSATLAETAGTTEAEQLTDVGQEDLLGLGSSAKPEESECLVSGHLSTALSACCSKDEENSADHPGADSLDEFTEFTSSLPLHPPPKGSVPLLAPPPGSTPAAVSGDLLSLGSSAVSPVPDVPRPITSTTALPSISEVEELAPPNHQGDMVDFVPTAAAPTEASVAGLPRGLSIFDPMPCKTPTVDAGGYQSSETPTKAAPGFMVPRGISVFDPFDEKNL